MARDFVKQILFSGDVDAMTGNFHRPAFLRVAHAEAQLLEDLFDSRIFNRCAEEGLNTLPSQPYCCRISRSWINIDDLIVNGPPANGLNQRCSAIARVASHLNVGSAFESIRSFA